MPELPSWRQLVSLISSYPKPPLRAWARERSPQQMRETLVIHDGEDGWYIAEEDRTELSTVGSATIIDRARFETIRGVHVASNGWVKSMIQGKLIAYLAESSGRVLDSDVAGGRSCWVAEARGVSADEPEAVFRLWIDTAAGIILRLERTDIGGTVIELVDVELGTVVENAPLPGDRRG